MPSTGLPHQKLTCAARRIRDLIHHRKPTKLIQSSQSSNDGCAHQLHLFERWARSIIMSLGWQARCQNKALWGVDFLSLRDERKRHKPTKACWERWCVFSSECQIQLLTRIGCSCSCPVGRVAPLLLNLQKVVLRQCLLPHTSQVLWRLCALPLVVFTFGTPPHIDHAVKNDVLEIRAADDTSEFNISRLG